MSDATRAQQTADWLQERLLRGDWLCGDRLVEIQLARERGVSQNTVREALRLLEEAGWVRKQPRRGVFVRAFDEADVQELVLLWATVETLALDWAWPSLTPAIGLQWRQTLVTVELNLALGDHLDALNALYRLHAAIAQQAAKPHTAAILRRLHHHVRLLETLREHQAPLIAPQWEDRLSLYHGTLDAIDQEQAERAHESLHAAITWNLPTFLEVIAP